MRNSYARKTLILVLVLLMSLVALAGCRQEQQEMREMDPELNSKVNFARDNCFGWSVMINEKRVVLSGDPQDFFERAYGANLLGIGLGHLAPPEYEKLVFVLSQEEAESQDWPDSTVVAWPDPELTQGFVNGLNLDILYSSPTSEDFGLGYPVTVENFATDWKRIRDFRNHIRENDLSGSQVEMRVVEQHGAEARLAELEILRIVEDSEAYD